MRRIVAVCDRFLAESLFPALKNERVHRSVCATKAQAFLDVVTPIETFYVRA